MITEGLDDFLLEVRACAGAKRNEVRCGNDGIVKVSVTQQPEKGKANKAIRELLVKTLQIKNSQIELIQGETSQTKKFLLRNIKINEIKNKLKITVHENLSDKF
ncbi:MAG: DUF167 family protein [Planctomycetaceae bacterium]|jgi:uncharacterized protein (TIGR00251 family)|nr:DUF167 family protein [Planctomycetaceae bacterium]